MLSSIVLRSAKRLLNFPKELKRVNRTLVGNNLPPYFYDTELLEPFNIAYRPSNYPKIDYSFPFNFTLEKIYLFYVPDFPKDMFITRNNIDQVRAEYEIIVDLKSGLIEDRPKNMLGKERIKSL